MSLTDQSIVDGTFKVDKLEELLDSPDQDESGAYNTLISYKVKAEGKGKGKGKSDKSGKSPKFEQVKNVTVSNALDSLMEDLLVVNVKKSTRLFVPTTVPGGVDPFLCYDVKVSKDTEKFPKGLQAFAVDQRDLVNTEPKLFDIKKPKRLCNPVALGTGIANPLQSHLICYDAKLVKDEPKHGKVEDFFVEDQFGPHTIDVKAGEGALLYLHNNGSGSGSIAR